MNWRECVRFHESWGGPSRFEWPLGPDGLGFDCNPGALTLSDLTGAAGWLWTWPGDWFLRLPFVRTFFELGLEPAVGNGWSYAMPIVAYPLLIFVAYVAGGALGVVVIVARGAAGGVIQGW